MAVMTAARPGEDLQKAPRPLMPLRAVWTVDDLDRLPDDGLQYELLDGVLVVSPSPSRLHQVVALNAWSVLADECPDEMLALAAPFDFRPVASRSAQPDVLVARNGDFGDTDIAKPLLLAVEVLSPSTRGKDLRMKRALYEREGVASFWVIDPEVPSLVAYDLVDGAYIEVTRGAGAELMQLRRPYAVTIVPEALQRPRRRSSRS